MTNHDVTPTLSHDSAVAAPEDGGARRDLSLVHRLEGLTVAVVSDCLDRAGLRNQVMDRRIRPLTVDSRVAGIAATVLPVAVYDPPSDPADSYAGELAAVDALRPGDVMTVGTCERSYWGELLATAAVARGARGLVGDVWTRDTTSLIAMGFPTFVAGIQPQDSLGRLDVVASGVAIECGGVRVENGDLVLGDYDGVVVIPQAVAVAVIEDAENKVRIETDMRSDLDGGLSVRAAFHHYGVL